MEDKRAQPTNATSSSDPYYVSYKCASLGFAIFVGGCWNIFRETTVVR